MDVYNQIFDLGNRLVGSIGGDLFDVWRPDYSQVDNAPTLVASGVKFRTDPTGYKFAEPLFTGVQYYDIFGPKDLILPGDVLVKTTPDGMTPAVTVITKMPLKAVSGFRSSRRGKIVNSDREAAPVYDNIYMDFMNVGYPGSALNRTLEQSLKVANTRIAIFTRPNVTRQRMHLIETDLSRVVTLPDGTTQSFQRKWLIDEIDFSGNLMILSVRGA